MPAILGVVETAIYVTDLDATAAFYSGVLGLPELSREAGRHVFFRVGPRNVLLAFIAATTIRGEHLPAHGATGPGHFALGIVNEALESWRDHLDKHGIAIEHELTWPRGGRSLYFRDPAGNSVELVTPGIWGLPEGW